MPLRRPLAIGYYLVSAWAADNRLVLGQVAVDQKSNEMTATPQLLDLLNRRDCTVTINALGYQIAIAQQIVQRGRQYVLTLKGNQPTMLADMQALFADARSTRQPAYGMPTTTTVEKNHGRIETRRAFVISDPAVLQYLNEQQHWAQVRSVALVKAERQVQDVMTEQR